VALDLSVPELAVAAPQPSTYVAGSATDFDRLYRMSYSRLLLVLTGILGDPAAAEDCVQETFVRAYRAWPRWRPDAPPEAWLHRIALNVANSYRLHNGLQGIGEILRRLGKPKTADAAQVGLRSELVDALKRLPSEQAAVIILRHHHGYSNREIARVLEVPESTIAFRLAKAKERLRKELGEAH
jgi:RNA polymerase sigma-70 factor, ECF subfamily